jgi:hypothetical protein
MMLRPIDYLLFGMLAVPVVALVNVILDRLFSLSLLGRSVISIFVSIIVISCLMQLTIAVRRRSRRNLRDQDSNSREKIG